MGDPVLARCAHLPGSEKFRPWLVETYRLFEAMNTLDCDKKRGLLMIE